MKIKLHSVAIRTNATTTVIKNFTVAEVQILKAVHGEGNVIDQGDAKATIEVESVGEEMARLSNLYGRKTLEELYGKLLEGLKQKIESSVVKTASAKE